METSGFYLRNKNTEFKTTLIFQQIHSRNNHAQGGDVGHLCEKGLKFYKTGFIKVALSLVALSEFYFPQARDNDRFNTAFTTAWQT